MLKDLVLSAAAAGLAAGLLTAALQHVTTTPIIIAAERYEAAAGHSHHAGPAEAQSAHSHGPQPASAEQPAGGAADGFSRTLQTSLSTAVMGVGFGLTLLAAMVLSGTRIDARSGLAFGAAGFAAVTLAPALGLPPELPGSGAAPLAARQLWWFCTAGATAAGLAALLLTRSTVLKIGGAVLIAAPHIFGAPGDFQFASTAPAELAAQFVASSLAVTAVFWGVLGAMSGAVYRRIAGPA